MFNQRQREAAADEAAAAVETMAMPAATAELRALQTAAAAIRPAVSPTERYRANTKDLMLREFDRIQQPPEVRADAGTRDTPLEAGTVVQVVSEHGTVQLADLEGIDDDRAAEAVAALEAIVERYDARSRHA